ncbi:hypothetical protein MKD01_05055 [[Clostridium] innocuum]|nr:hypothetical protein [Erysipelotrichaceae bacterium]MCR0132356.1 hypothetical protein [[Clostridium] innocuum]MCR0284674.1 hypothetical protein [[Clostridium] innocuum]MCR0386815.1 hypothetical protein [[Clostridium] innocuum]MDU3789946.1 hypothetical protein [Erysipelotrichaceae bacterium]
MFFHSWRRKRKLKRFRPIMTLHLNRTLHHEFHPTFLKAKTVLREVRSSVIRKEEHTHHIHHMMTLHVHQAQTFLMLNHQNDERSLIIQSKKVINKKYPSRILQLHLAKQSIERLAEQRLLEEKSYYKYHPAKAKELAASYLHNREIKNCLNTHMNRLSQYSYAGSLFRSSLFTTLSSQSWKQVLTPVIYQQSRALIHREKIQLQREVISEKSRDEMHVEREPEHRAAVQRNDMNTLVNTVIREVERRAKRERLREGRR